MKKAKVKSRLASKEAVVVTASYASNMTENVVFRSVLVYSSIAYM